MHRMTVLAVMIAALSTACTRVKVPDVPEGVPVTYADHLEPLVIARCLTCHTAEEPEAQLVFEAGTGYGEMVGRASTQVADARCRDRSWHATHRCRFHQAAGRRARTLSTVD